MRWLQRRVGPLKTKLGLVILAGVLVSDVAAIAAIRLGVPLPIAAVAAAALALALVRVVARGLTHPLREMAAASHAMASGHTGEQVGGTERSDEIGELARAFNAMSAELAEVDRQRRDLVANVSHELRTPLSALQARLENVADGVEPADAETVQTMLAQVRRLGRLVEQLLDLSRLESQAHPFAAEPFAVASVLEGVAGEARLSAPGDVELRVDAPADLIVSGDSERVHQVSRAALQIPQGSLYPALHRLERKGWITATWGASENNRRAKYYELTRAGRRQLEVETALWRRLTAGVELVLRMS